MYRTTVAPNRPGRRGPALGGFSLTDRLVFRQTASLTRPERAVVGPVHAHQRGSNRGARARGTRHFRASEAVVALG